MSFAVMISSSNNFFPHYFIEYQGKSKLAPFLACGETDQGMPK
jgi:hypothetical protein